MFNSTVVGADGTMLGLLANFFVRRWHVQLLHVYGRAEFW